jgi:primosomal protein N' (replication factor Y) (superfamily II helicase)
MRYFVEVILPLALPKTFTYEVSQTEFEFIQPGMRIAVSFGKNKIYTSIAFTKHHDIPTLYEPKEIYQILDEKPIVNQVQIEHWFWIANYYMCAIGDVYRGAVPSSLLLESETIISLNKENTIDQVTLSDDEFLIFEALQRQSSLKVQDVISILNKKTVLPIINRLLDKKIVTIFEEIKESYSPKLVRYIRLSSYYQKEENLMQLLESQKSEKRKQLLLQYFQLHAQEKKPIALKKLIETANVSTSIIKAMVEKQIFEEYFIQEDRVNFDTNKKEQELHLSEAQHIALQQIQDSFLVKDVSLLHGVTSSGKTEIYTKLIEDYISQGKQVLYLLPEIALTTQLVSRLTQYFGNKVAVFHSKYSNNERVEVWKNVLDRRESAQIVIGARSALFLPFSNLGLIIVDEEHEPTFKQYDPSPRYHARDAAIVLAHLQKAKVLLGSATPSIETFHNTVSGKYGMISLTERFGNVQLPEIELVDLKDNYFRKKMNGHFSLTLIEAITEAFSNNEQVILFQNRRGFSPVLECMTCGHVPQCPNCDVSLTFHKFKNQLRCHYCSYAIAKPSNCHVCSSIDLTTKGFGTEQIELELASLFPQKNIKRMDQDTTQGKYSFERIIDGFKNREIDVLVGTQMLAKGLDFDNVSLVGIMNADTLLYYPDFRAFERSFQLLTQVAGRSGRSEKRGKVIIQTYNPSHTIIQQVTHNDYQGMYKEQLYERKIYHYPPFFRLIRITIKHRDYDKLKNASLWMYQVLQQQLEVKVLGPEEPAIGRIRNEYIRTIVIKIPKEGQLLSIKKTIQKVLNSFDNVVEFRNCKTTIDVDFY